MKLAVLYAGQGAQHPGMGREFYEDFPAFRAPFDRAALEFDLHRVCFEDPDGVLNQNRIHPALHGGLCLRRQRRAGRKRRTALLCCRALSRRILRAGSRRGVHRETGHRAGRLSWQSHGRRGQGHRLRDDRRAEPDRDALAVCCKEASALGCVQICNYNCPGQLVIGGENAAVDKAAELAKAAGARRCIPLKVSGPFHTRLMAPAGDALAKRFETEAFGEMQVPVLFNCLGREMPDGSSIPALLVKQVQSSVYMEDTLRRLGQLGVDHILEVGPGSALSGFVKKTLPGVVCTSVETPAQLDAVLTAWKEEQ